LVVLIPSLFLLVSTVIHSLRYAHTGSSEIPNVPDTVAVVIVDGYQTNHYDSITRKMVPTQTWMSRVSEDDPDYWERETSFWRDQEQYARMHIEFYKDYQPKSQPPKTPSSPVSCLATGFYPHRAAIFWRKDGEEIHEQVDHGELLNNHDGSFQMSVDLNMSLIRADDWRRYHCVFQLSGVEEDMVTELDPALIRTNWAVRAAVFPWSAC
uniref:Ig-like domain-containing protein n=1 Tax=Sparus aurata TaxID=8175 RepID=A0A671UVT2_SPAAU